MPSESTATPGFRISEVIAAVAVGPDDEEGVCAVLRNGVWMPLIAADDRRKPFIIEQATMIARETQALVRIIRLSGREEIDVIDGRQ